MEYEKRPEQQAGVGEPEPIRAELERSAHKFVRLHKKSERAKVVRAEAEKEFLENLAAHKAELNEKYVGETGKKVQVTGWAEVVVRPQEGGEWEYQQTNLNGKKLITKRVDVRNLAPELRTAETSMDLPSILRAADDDGNSYNIPLSEDTSVEFTSEE